MATVESRPGPLRRLTGRVFDAVVGLSPELYTELRELRTSFGKAVKGEITDPEEIEGLKERYHKWVQALHDHVRSKH